MFHPVTLFPLRTLGDRSGKNNVPHRSPPSLDNFSCTKKAGDLFVTKIEANQYLLNGNFDLKTALGSK